MSDQGAKLATRPVSDRHRLGEPFGYLLTLDLYGCKPGTCADISLCYNFLEALVGKLGMTVQAPPFLFRSPAAYPDKAGLSGWVPLIESGIQIHTLLVRNFVSIDIYCCHRFSGEDALALAAQYFSPRETEINEMPRGMKYNEVR